MAAAIPLGKILIENDLKKERKRKAQAIGVFLNVETQRKFMKMASNVELQKELHREVHTLDIYREQLEKLHCGMLLKDQQNID